MNKIFSYGGMPSAHAAMIFSLLTILYLRNTNIEILLVAVTFSSFTLWDALKLRKEIELHGKSLNQIIHKTNLKLLKVTEQVGHTFLQVFVGGIFGIFITYILFNYCNFN